MKIAVFDIESNGFLDSVTDIWCIWVKCPTTVRGRGWRPYEIDKAISFLDTCDVLIGHNIIDFDIPCIQKFYDFTPKGVFDTLVLSRMLYPARRLHGLKSYGIELENLKGDYGEQENAWDSFSEEQFDYCEQDVNLNIDVYHKLCERAGFDPEKPPALKWRY